MTDRSKPIPPAARNTMAALDAAAVAEGVAPSADGGNGTSTAPPPPMLDMGPVVTDVTAPSLTPDQPSAPFPEMEVPLRPGRKAPTAPRGQTLAQQVLPDPWRVVLRKVLPNAEESYIGNYSSQQIKAAGGNIETFIRTNLAGWIEAGLNRFRAYLRSPKGEEQPYGDVNVMGDPQQAATTPTAQAPTGNPLQDAMAAYQQIAEMQQKAEQRAREEAARAQEREQRMMDAIREMEQKRNSGGGGMSDMMGMMMVMKQMSPPPPPVDPQQNLLMMESMINRMMGPVIQQIGDIRTQIASVPPPPPPPPPDPLEGLAKLLEHLKPAQPSTPPMGPVDVLNLIDKLQPKETFNFKDVVALLPTIRESLGVTRMESEMARQNDRMERMLQTPARGIKDSIEDLRAVKEASDLLGGGGGGGGIDRFFSPEGFQAVSNLIASIKGNPFDEGGEEEQPPEERPIEVVDKGAPQAAPAPRKPPETKRARPQDMMLSVYPNGFQEVVVKLAEVGAKEPDDDKGKTKLIVTLMKSLQFLAFKDPTGWRPPILAMLAHAHDGERGAVTDFMGFYLKGLVDNKKLEMPVADVLHKVFVSNIDAAIKFVLAKMPGRKTAPAPTPATPK